MKLTKNMLIRSDTGQSTMSTGMFCFLVKYLGAIVKTLWPILASSIGSPPTTSPAWYHQVCLIQTYWDAFGEVSNLRISFFQSESPDEEYSILKVFCRQITMHWHSERSLSAIFNLSVVSFNPNSLCLQQFSSNHRKQILRKEASIGLSPNGRPTIGMLYLERNRSRFTFWILTPVLHELKPLVSHSTRERK